jgi:hypothetical protein
MTIQALIDEYIETRLAYDEVHALSSQADKEHKAVKARLVEAMVKEQQTGMKMDFGLGFNLRNQFSISCNVDNEEEVKTWLHDRYGDLEQFTTLKVAKKAVEEQLKADIEGEELDEFDVPEFLNLKTRPDVSCTGWKAYSAENRSKKS